MQLLIEKRRYQCSWASFRGSTEDHGAQEGLLRWIGRDHSSVAPCAGHSEGSKQERGPLVRFRSGRQIAMILEGAREGTFGSDEVGRQVKPWNTSQILAYRPVEGCWTDSRSRISTKGRGHVTKPKTMQFPNWPLDEDSNSRTVFEYVQIWSTSWWRSQ